jgi:outer membrane protein assembly factor BamB
VLDSNRPVTVPKTGDSDFGAAPVLFRPPGCPPLAAANNKDGRLYIWNRRRLAAGRSPRFASATTRPRSSASRAGRRARSFLRRRAALTAPNADEPKGVVALRVRSGCRFPRAWTRSPASGTSRRRSSSATSSSPDGGDSGDVFALDARIGRRLWRASTRRVAVGAPLVYAAGTLVAGDAKGTVYGFRVGPKR